MTKIEIKEYKKEAISIYGTSIFVAVIYGLVLLIIESINDNISRLEILIIILLSLCAALITHYIMSCLFLSRDKLVTFPHISEANKVKEDKIVYYISQIPHINVSEDCLSLEKGKIKISKNVTLDKQKNIIKYDKNGGIPVIVLERRQPLYSRGSLSDRLVIVPKDGTKLDTYNHRVIWYENETDTIKITSSIEELS